MAGLAMMVRNSGDPLFVAWPFFQEAPRWTYWPKQLGTPEADYEFESDGVLVRRFDNGTIRVDAVRAEVSIELSR